MINKVSIIIILLIAGCLDIWAYDYSKAEQAYNSKNYEEAVKLYSEAIDKEGVSAGLLYNLGNSYYRLGKNGDAILCYERAKKLDPGNNTINQNLRFLSTKIVDANKGELKGKNGNVEADPESFIAGIYRIIAVDTQSNYWAVFSVMAFILFLGGLALYTFTPNVLARKTGFFSGLTFLGFTVIFLIFAFLGSHEYNKQDKAILMDYTSTLSDQPMDNANSVTSPLHNGTKVTILETAKGQDGNEWLKVKLNNDNIGWIKKDKVEII